MGNFSKKFTSVMLSATTAVWLSGFSMIVPVAHAQTAADLQAQIQSLLSTIAALQAQLSSLQGGAAPSASCNFTRTLTAGVTGDDVKCLQQYLNGAGYKVADSGVGSLGNETTYFGSLTTAAVAKWQAANGVSPAVGYFGPISRAKYSSLVASGGPAPVPGAPTPSGSGLAVTLDANQPASGLFGESFASRPFTKLRFTASADGDVTVKALTVERTGQGNDAAFSGVVALDENGVRMGNSKTFGSDHRLRLTDTFVVKAGQTKTITLAGDSDSDQDAYNGQLVSLSLVGVETTGAAVNASFPLVGNVMTVNSTLAIGSLTLARGAFDPGSGQTKEIGTTNYTFSGLKLTAGSNEDVLVKSVKFNQSGSAATSDLANVKVVLDGVTYDTTVSSDGKYYTAIFGEGVKILKGFNKEMHVKADIVGGSNRTVDFDLYLYGDLQVNGLTYGYGILPTGSSVTTADNDDDGEFQDAEPRYDAFQVSIGAGTINVQNATTITAQNIAINLANQPLGGLIVDVKGEDVTVASINFDVSIGKQAGDSLNTDDITNITLVREDGMVVAGPVDGVAGFNNAIRFTDTVTFKPGRAVYTLKGKLGTDFGSDDTVSASTTPGSDWSTARGVTSGVSLTPTPGSAVTLSTMTVKAVALTVSLSSDTRETSNASSTAQNVVAGTSAYKFTEYILDASGSGEDIRVTALQLRLTGGGVNTADDLTNCQLYDNMTALNTGGNVLNPSNSDDLVSSANKTFTFDQSLVIPKGTIKTLALKCNIVSGVSTPEFYQWGITDQDASITATGVISGSSVDGSDSITATDDGRVINVITSGGLSVTEDPVSALKWVQAGSTDNTMLSLRFNATDEDVRLDTLGLQLATSTNAADGMASNSPSDVSKVTIWNGSSKVGEAIFTSNDYATATLSGAVVPRNGQLVLTVKADLGAIGTGLAARPGHLVVVNYDANSSSDKTNRGAVGTGLSSGTTVGSGGNDTSANGARLAKAVPTVAKLSLPSNTFAQTASSKSLYRFSVSAPAGTNGVSLYKFTFNVSTTSAGGTDVAKTGDSAAFRIRNFQVKCYSDAFVTAACGNSNGLLNQFGLAIADGTNLDFDDTVTAADPDVDVSVYFNPTASSGSTAERVGIPAGSTYYFELLGDIANATSTAGIEVRMMGDASYVGCTNDGATAPNVSCDGAEENLNGDDWSNGRYAFATTAAHADLWGDNDFIWSGNSTNTTQSIVSYDWFSGFLVPGLSNTDTGTAESLNKSS